jgi:hypothetical protein
MTLPTDIEREKATQKPTLKDLIFAQPSFFCFSANAVLAHWLLHLPSKPTVQQKPKSQFCPPINDNFKYFKTIFTDSKTDFKLIEQDKNYGNQKI